MSEFKPKAIVKLQNFITSANIESLIKKFIKKKFHKENPPTDINYDKGILFYYNSDTDKSEEIRFEDELKKMLWNLTNEIKSEIDSSNFILTSKEKFKFWEAIIKSFDFIRNHNIEIISLFPVCVNPFKEIENYLEEKYKFSLASEFDKNNYFKIKSKYLVSDLHKIYDFISGESYIDDELFSFSDFISVLFDKQTDVRLIFNCRTEIMVCILDSQPCFITQCHL